LLFQVRMIKWKGVLTIDGFDSYNSVWNVLQNPRNTDDRTC
jgi:hypothetical protein